MPTTGQCFHSSVAGAAGAAELYGLGLVVTPVASKPAGVDALRLRGRR